MLTAKQQEVLLSMAQKQQNADELRNTNEELADDVAFKEQQAEELTRQAADLGDQVTAAEQERKRVQDTIRTRQEELKEAHDQQLLLHQEQSRVEQKKSKQEAELDNSINHLWDEYELTVTTAAEFRIALESMAKAQRRINELRGQMRALGNVNVDAIEEYRSIKERYDFLTAQRDDLVEAQHHLEQVIKNMMSIMREQFGEKFKLINQYFGETFVQLFGGGKATLALTDPSDVLGSGVDINVQPPGKSLKNMMQLSGGEQAFVSIALLFAIMRVRPAPFCILDEIEAALDDVNVYRFADYLKTFAKTSQFVVVTHRRGTMEAANILYGVTMQERGVTKLLTLNIDEVVPNSK